MSDRYAEEIDLAPWEEEALGRAWAGLEAAGAAEFAVRHAPHDMTVAGKHFRGGQFVPREDYAAATRGQKAALDAHAFDRAVAALSDPAAGPEAHALAFETLEGLTPTQLRKAAAALGADADPRDGKRALIGAIRARVIQRGVEAIGRGSGAPAPPAPRPAPAPPPPPAPATPPADSPSGVGVFDPLAHPPPLSAAARASVTPARLAAVARAVGRAAAARHNLASLVDVKAAADPGGRWPMEEFHAAVDLLAHEGAIGLTGGEGRHGISPVEMAHSYYLLTGLPRYQQTPVLFVSVRDHARLADFLGGGHG